MSSQIFKTFWKVRLKGARELHVTYSDEFGQPRLVTFCGKEYQSEDRIHSEKSRKDLNGKEFCPKCVESYERWERETAREILDETR
jgi:hypothetical protein